MPAPDDVPESPDHTPEALPARRPGRPGLVREQVAEALDAFTARAGRSPSVRELRDELGSGSLATISRLRGEIQGERLIAAGGAPATGSMEAALLKALSVTMTALAAEAGEAADAAIARAGAEAEERVTAADARRERAEAESRAAALERERANGQVAALEADLGRTASRLTTAERDLAELQAYARSLSATVAAREADMATRESELERLDADRTAALNRVDERDATLGEERARRSAAESAVEQLDARLTDAREEAKFAGASHREAIDALQVRLDTTSALVAERGGELATLETRLEERIRAHTSADERIARLEADLAAERAKAQAANDAIGAHVAEALRRLEKRLPNDPSAESSP